MDLLFELALVITIAGICGYATGVVLERWQKKRRQWWLRYGSSEYSNKGESREDKEECMHYLQRVLKESSLEREMRYRLVFGIARGNYRLLAEVIADMMATKEVNRPILEFLSTPLSELGLRPGTYASLQSFFSYLDKFGLERYTEREWIPTAFGKGMGHGYRGKRAIDFVVSLLLLILLSPVFGILVFLLWWQSPDPVIRKTRHLGLKAKPFTRYSFKTFPLSVNRLPSGDPQELIWTMESQLKQEYASQNRLRRNLIIGLNLHRLPELVNVLKGDMSLIGPSPLSVYQVPLLSFQEVFDNLPQMLSIRPGCVGESQLQVYSNWKLTLPEIVQVDMQYITNMSFMQDLKLFWGVFRSYMRNIGRVIGGGDDWFARFVRGLTYHEADSRLSDSIDASY